VAHVGDVGPEQAVEDVRRGRRIGAVDVGALAHRLADASADRDMDAAAAVGARLVCPGDLEWPALLDDLARTATTPFGLWVRGAARLDEACAPAAAVVGTRTATDYGLTVAGDISAGLADRGWTVVSGLAYGIDGAAHRGALAAGGLTVAVLACGVDVGYPPGHRTLFEQVAQGGLVISEHPPGAAPQRHRFLVRNRLIAALSLGTVVVEMAPRSGAMSTALHAERLLRHVMAVPGPVTSSMSAGCHLLLRERPGAVLVTRAAEVVEQCGHLGELAEPLRGPMTARDALGPLVSRVFDAVPVRRTAALERIAAVAGVRPEVARASLAALVEQGLVSSEPTGWRMSAAGRDQRGHRRSPADDQLALDCW
jgi:DNA processing protein